ncbi:MAG: hypothetical protein J6Q80_05430 [Lentisphaeria bacterium]|nr:hypothetical protein [Lentisphaeria bacterium]
MTTKNNCCFGKFDTRPECRNCRYRVSCKYYTGNPVPNCPEGNCVSYESIANWCQEAADPAPVPGEDDPAERELIGIDKLAEFFRYLLNLDKYTLEILRMLFPADGSTGVCSVSDIARQRGCTRQAAHHKILNIIKEHPELTRLFSLTLRHLPRDRRRYAAV